MKIKTNIKKIAYILVINLVMLATVILTSCGNSENSISVITREEGSGTRSAFVELFGVEENKVDSTTDTAVVSNSTENAIQSVVNDDGAIGYISLGSLKDDIKAIKIDGVEPTVDNVKSGEYKIVRPFNIVVNKNKKSDAVQDFINYILSGSGQDVVKQAGYVTLDKTNDFTTTNPSGKITISGSSSVSPVMEKLIEGYNSINQNLKIELQTLDSTSGINNSINGVSDIGMASRDLKESELNQGVEEQKIAQDGLAVIVNKNNSVNNLTKEQVKDIFTGKVDSWDDVENNSK
ncbi:MAG: substrate-binding domain-containing protein [Candidatus Ancillula sp.]|jgi:phosphate transport system substrate-binding protein|nr:substrate-binding domain-containing protein [Candidatus Ancillula sp.]